jgi:hypothetical protein
MGRLLIVAIIALACAVISLQAPGDEVRAYGQVFRRNQPLSGAGEADWEPMNSEILWGGKQQVFRAWPDAKDNSDLYLTLYGSSAEALSSNVSDFLNGYNRSAEFVTCISPPVKAKPEEKPAPSPLVTPTVATVPTPTPPSSALVEASVKTVSPMSPPAPQATSTAPAPAAAIAAAPPQTQAPAPPPVPEEERQRCHLKTTRVRVQLKNTLPPLVQGVGGDSSTTSKYFEAKPFSHEFRSFVVTFQGPAARELYLVYLAHAVTGGDARKFTRPAEGQAPVLSELKVRTGALGNSPIECELMKRLHSSGQETTTYTCRILQDTFVLRRNLTKE